MFPLLFLDCRQRPVLSSLCRCFSGESLLVRVGPKAACHVTKECAYTDRSGGCKPPCLSLLPFQGSLVRSVYLSLLRTNRLAAFIAAAFIAGAIIAVRHPSYVNECKRRCPRLKHLRQTVGRRIRHFQTVQGGTRLKSAPSSCLLAAGHIRPKTLA